MRWLRLFFLPVSVVVLLSAAYLVPLPYFVEAPGGTLGLGERVEVGTSGEKLQGDFELTTVNLRPGTAFGLVRAAAQDDLAALPTQAFIPEGQDQEAYFDRQRDVFDSTADVAAAVGLRAAGYDVGGQDLSGKGAAVVQITSGSPAEEVLRPGDVVTAVDGEPVQTAEQLTAAIGQETVSLTYRRNGQKTTRQITPERMSINGDSQVVIGAGVRTVIDLPVPVEVDSGQIGGPSAGLMIALTVYDKADDADLARDRDIAGTGRIARDGAVGPIGGIRFKVLAAARDGADVFLAPAEQVQAARAAVPERDELEVVGVASLQEALEALRKPAV